MAWWNNWLIDRMKGDINEMLKVDGDQLPDVPENKEPAREQVGRKAIIEDPYFDHVSQTVLYKHRSSRLSNKTLKDVSIRDWLVSSILQNRGDTMLRFARPEHDKFKTGFRFVKRNKDEDISADEREEMANLESFIYNCGRVEGTPADDKQMFGSFLKKGVRDALTIGHLAIEKVKTKNGGLHRFRVIPAESVYIINKQATREQIESAIKTHNLEWRRNQPNNPEKEYQLNEADLEFLKWVQVSIDQTPLSAFGDEDMIFKLFNEQNFLDGMGYCYSHLEMAIINVTNHLNVENYNSNFFTHGYAARGLLHLKGTVTQSQLAAFRRQFYNTINGAMHAWKTPIIAGLDDIQWIQMAGSNREMEYINFNNHILRAICTQFQIDPIELGLDYLTTGTGRAPTQQANNQFKIEYAKERGLQPILMFFEDLINLEIVPALDKDLAERYKFEFVGYTDETPQTLVAQQQAEMTVHSSMNDLLKQAQKCALKYINEEGKEVTVPGSNLPLNQSFWMLIEKNYTRGQILEIFFGDKGASKRRELAYIPGDPMFSAWQQLLLTIDRQKFNDKMMQQQMQAQQEAQDKAESREQEAHDMEMNDKKNAAAHSVVNKSNLKDTAKEYGAASKAIHVGKESVANPINAIKEEE